MRTPENPLAQAANLARGAERALIIIAPLFILQYPETGERTPYLREALPRFRG